MNDSTENKEEQIRRLQGEAIKLKELIQVLTGELTSEENIVKWNSLKIEPPKWRVLAAFCPEWSEAGYQICRWNGKEFYYDEQPNDSFNVHVKSWSLIFEAA